MNKDMTREEAIARIKDHKIIHKIYEGDPRTFYISKALDMAIESLEQESQSKSEDIAKAFQLGLAIGFGERYDELDRVIDEIKKVITPQNEVDI